jgi:hypothetical protein
LAARAQQAMPVIGYLIARSPDEGGGIAAIAHSRLWHDFTG